jgi:GTP cyclohydrolase IA
VNAHDFSSLQAICYELLSIIGDDPTRDGLKDTPLRWASFWKEWAEYDAGNSDTTFEAVSADQLVSVSDIHVTSLCEHHLLPFTCDISIAYITKEKVLGLSKFARIAQQHSHKLQLQERLCQEIAADVMRYAETPDVAVLGVGRHMCMSMRGVKQDATMRTSVMLGAFRTEGEARQEVLHLWHMKG